MPNSKTPVTAANAAVRMSSIEANDCYNSAIDRRSFYASAVFTRSRATQARHIQNILIHNTLTRTLGEDHKKKKQKNVPHFQLLSFLVQPIQEVRSEICQNQRGSCTQFISVKRRLEPEPLSNTHQHGSCPRHSQRPLPEEYRHRPSHQHVPLQTHR